MNSKNSKAELSGKTNNKNKKNIGSFKWMIIVIVISVIILGVIAIATKKDNETSVIDFPDIHGLGYSGDGKAFYVPVHDGLRIYSDSKWEVPDKEKNDYMGFTMVDDGFYSSGHPGPDSKLENPLGIVKSNDLGKPIKILDLYKEIDFHGMAAGYYSHAIYVLNPEPNSRMEETGLYYTVDDTKNWNKSKMEGLTGQPASIAVHPTDEKIVAIGTNTGAFLSTDSGNTFESILPDVPTSAIHFTNENKLVVGGLENGSVVYSINPDTKVLSKISIPKISNEDAITYIAVNPQNSSEIVFTTFERQIYLSKNNGNSWTQITQDGKEVLEKK